MLSQSMENYVKAVFELQQTSEWVSTSALARRMQNAPASVTNMIKKLADPSKGLLEYVPYRGVRLTASGEEVALEVIRHHRLIELYLAEIMGVPWDEVHAEAEKIEHVISEDLEERMAAALGHPTIDPHGSPIPAKDGVMVNRALLPLTQMTVGQSAIVAEVQEDEDPALLRYLGDLGLYPDQEITLVAREPFDGPLKIRLANMDELRAVGFAVAEKVSVIIIDDLTNHD